MYKYDTSILEDSAKHYEKEIKDIKRVATKMLEEGNLSEKVLETVLNKIQRLSHRAGHCRGEKYVKDNFHVKL